MDGSSRLSVQFLRRPLAWGYSITRFLITYLRMLPECTFKATIVAMTFGVALLSLVVQAEILQVSAKRMKL